MSDTLPFTQDFFAANRYNLFETTHANLIVLAAHGLLQRSTDTTFPFRQDSNFWYLTGINEADYVLVMHEGESFLIAPKRGDHRDLWDGAIDKKALKRTSGISRIIEHHEGWVQLDLLIKKYKKVHTITPAEPYFDAFGFYANPARGALLHALQKHRKIELVDVRKTLAGMRQIKRPCELAALQQAIDITAGALKKVKKNLGRYKSEGQIAADITHEFLLKGSQGHAYQPIVASGKNAATIHYTQNDGALAADQLLLIDTGAEVHNYSADITRTYALSSPTKRQQQIFDSVKNVHAEALKLLRPGVHMRAYEEQIDAFMAKELVRVGLIDDASNKKQLKKYYPHLTSHFLGLDTHDAALYDLPLAPGMVLTVEPGIYIPEESIGIRIEDDVLITDSGTKVLSAALPHDL